MPADTNFTTRFRCDVSDLKKGITEANKQIKLANAQFKAASAGMDDWEESADGLRAKLSQLESVISAQTSKLNAYQKQLERVEAAEAENAKRAAEVRAQYQQIAEQYGKNSDEAKKFQKALSDIEKEQANNAKAADDLRIKILNQTAEVKKAESQFAKYEKALDGIENATKSVEKSSDDLGDSVQSASDAAANAGNGFTVFKGALADLISNGIQLAVDWIKDLVSGVLELSEATREYRSMQATLAGSAESFGYSVEFAKQQFGEFYSYVADDQMATNAITNLLGMQVSTESVSAAANAAIAVWSAYGDSIPIEGLTEFINESAQVREVTGSLADALNWAGISEDEFNKKLAKTTSTQEAADLIAQTLNETYGDSKKTYDELNGSIADFNSAQLELRDTQAEIGAIVEPVNAKLAELKNQILEPLIPIIQQVSTEFLNWTETIDWDAVGTEIGNAVGVAKDVFQWIIDNKDTIVGGLQAILAGFIAFKSLTFIAGLVTTLQQLVTAITGAQTAAAAFSAVIGILGGPVTVVIAVITALVAAFTYLWNTCEPFKQFWLDLWDNVKNIASDAAEFLAEFFTVRIPEAFKALTDWFAGLPETFKQYFDEVISTVQEWGTNLVEKAVETGKNFVDGAISFFEELPYNVGYLIGQALAEVVLWAADMADAAKKAGSDFVNNVVSFFKNLPKNISEFITSAYQNVTTWAANMGAKASEAGKTFVNNVVNFFKNLPANVLTWLNNTVNNVVKWGSDLWKAGTDAAGQLFDAVVTGVKELPAKMLEIGEDIVSGVWDGINNAKTAFTNNVKNFFGGIVDGVKDTLGIHSPSTVFAEIGGNMVEGLEQGYVKNLDDAKEEIEKETKSIADVVSETVEPVFDALATSTNIAALKLEVWENACGDAATESEKLAKELETITAQQNNQAQAVTAAQWAYDKIVAAYGETSALAMQYKETLLQEIAAYQELTNKVNDLNIALAAQSEQTQLVQAQSTIAQSQYDLWAASVGQTASESEKLAMQLQLLTEQQTYQQQVVANAKAAYEAVCLQYGENSIQSLQYQQTLLQEQLTLQNLTNQVNTTTQALADSQNQMLQLQTAMQSAITETGNFGNAITQLGNATSDMGELMGNDAVSDVGSFISKIGNGIGTVLNFASSIIGLVSAIKSLAGAFSTVSSIFGGAAALGGAGLAAGGGLAAAGTAAGAGGLLATIAGGLSTILPAVLPVLAIGGGLALVAALFGSSKKKTTTTTTTSSNYSTGASSAQISSIQSTLSTVSSKVASIATSTSSIQSLVSELRNSINSLASKLNISSTLQSIASGINGLSEDVNNFRAAVSNSVNSINASSNANLSSGGVSGGVGGTNITYNQTINSPKPLNRLEIYRQTKNQLNLVGG